MVAAVARCRLCAMHRCRIRGNQTNRKLNGAKVSKNKNSAPSRGFQWCVVRDVCCVPCYVVAFYVFVHCQGAQLPTCLRTSKIFLFSFSSNRRLIATPRRKPSTRRPTLSIPFPNFASCHPPWRLHCSFFFSLVCFANSYISLSTDDSGQAINTLCLAPVCYLHPRSRLARFFVSLTCARLLSSNMPHVTPGLIRH